MLALDKMYVVLCALFSILIVICNLTNQKFVYLPILPFHTFTLSVGAILYPFMFMLTDLIAEFYDKKRANFCVRLAVVMNVVVALFITSMDLLQATPWSNIDSATFHKVFGHYGFAFIANIVACYTAQLIDISLYLWIKKLTKNKWLWLRNNGSTAVSLFVDTFTAILLLTALGVFPKEHMWIIMLNSYSYKIFITICNTPLFYLWVGIIRKFVAPKKLTLTEQQLNTA